MCLFALWRQKMFWSFPWVLQDGIIHTCTKYCENFHSIRNLDKNPQINCVCIYRGFEVNMFCDKTITLPASPPHFTALILTKNKHLSNETYPLFGQYFWEGALSICGLILCDNDQNSEVLVLLVFCSKPSGSMAWSNLCIISPQIFAQLWSSVQKLHQITGHDEPMKHLGSGGLFNQ